MLERAADIRLMVRHLHGLQRDRAIARMDAYVLDHLALAARRGAYAHGPTTLCDTQELEVARC